MVANSFCVVVIIALQAVSRCIVQAVYCSQFHGLLSKLCVAHSVFFSDDGAINDEDEDDEDEEMQPSRRSHRRSQVLDQSLPLDNAILQDLLMELIHHKDAWPFLRPVQKAQVPDYHLIIKRPMDFGRIKNKLNMLVYVHNSEFIADTLLVFENCQMYNQSEAEEYKAACDPFLKCKLAFCKTIADECQPFLQRFQTSKPMTPYLFEAVEKLLRYLMNRCVKPDLMKCTGPKLLSIDTKKSENLILSKNIDIGFATKRLLGETAITVTERQKLEFIHECRSMLTTMIAKLQEKSPLKQKAVRGLSSLDPCVIQHSPQLAQKRFSFLLEELNHANIINDVLAENAKKEYLHFCNLKKSELQEIFRPCDQFSDEVGLDTIYGSFLIGEANYKHLWEVIKICLVLSHGNATVEGGFSVNKSLLVENMHEKTVIAQRHIHDEIQEAGGIKNIHISKKMLDYVRGARKRYHEYLEMKKQEKSEKDKKKAEKRKLDIQVKDLEGERKKLMMATEEKREAIDVELQELKKKQASLY
uniref:Bromo domain-containing protein n=1 Tax=Timema cristinae TaxID=61476 RepID=A0A7R9D140_TIMCR|nr:unnamed protein product [Timema cristinae]